MDLIKRTFFYILTLTILTTVVFAFNSNLNNNPDNPQNFGHSADEMLINLPNIGEITLQEAINQEIIGFNKIIVKDVGEKTGVTSTIHEIAKPSCPQNYIPQISANAVYISTVGTVDNNDILGTWVIEDGNKWKVKVGDFDTSINTGSDTTFPIHDNSAKSKLSYMIYCKLS